MTHCLSIALLVHHLTALFLSRKNCGKNPAPPFNVACLLNVECVNNFVSDCRSLRWYKKNVLTWMDANFPSSQTNIIINFSVGGGGWESTLWIYNLNLDESNTNAIGLQIVTWRFNSNLFGTREMLRSHQKPISVF